MADLENKEVIDGTTLMYLETLGTEELGKLLKCSPFTKTILAASEHSSDIAEKINDVLDAEYAAMTPVEKARIDRIAEKMRAKLGK